MKFLKHRFRQIKKLPDWIFFFPVLIIRIMELIMRKEIHDPQKNIDVNKFPFITVTWHNRLFFFAAVFPRDILERTAAVVSASRDGQYLVDTLARFRVSSIRGSSSKRGGVVIREAEKCIKNKMNVALTPDGPRGPKYKMSQGPIHLASITGAPIVPISINFDDYWELNSWDNFQIPKPWSKYTLEIGEKIIIPKDLDKEGFEKYQRKVEEKLMEVTLDNKKS